MQLSGEEQTPFAAQVHTARQKSMVTDKTRKRPVEWSRYLRTKLVQYLGCMGIIFVGVRGVALLIAGVALIWNSFLLPDPVLRVVALVFGVLLLVIAVASITQAGIHYRNLMQMEQVALLTKNNVEDLPEVETLVRGSDRPETVEQTELLRATRKSPEAPPEQLLRATNENRQDV
ncbi:MAG: hypothetical protein JWL77_2949 [Chthonomonadaceae bacterium]|nr:hypothetical protein [Chthonomonadaceae bacterium]